MYKNTYHKFFSMCSISLPIQKKKNEFCHYGIHEGWTKWVHYTKMLSKKQWKCICLKKHTISFATCAQFHCQIQKKKDEFCHYDIHKGWTKRAHCTKILLNKRVHVYMYQKKNTINFLICAQFHCQIQKKKKKKSSVIKIYMRDEPSGHIKPKYC